uniref:Regulatory protein zeste n=1 Tax=Romanomermis culicivorax TaxID=13658 RepID=A0A915JPS1_ROMCU
MEISAKNRERNFNFDVEETEFLLQCISERVDTIENKKTDLKSMHAKSSSWNAIEEAFSINPNVKKRSKEQLFDKWRNLKVLYKTAQATITAEHFSGLKLMHFDKQGKRRFKMPKVLSMVILVEDCAKL